jgi:hypothetical protein
VAGEKEEGLANFPIILVIYYVNTLRREILGKNFGTFF